MKIPLMALYAILAFNLLMFTLLFQFDLLEFHSPVGKAISWALTAAASYLTWANRDRFIQLK
jgi:hypothetical protein